MANAAHSIAPTASPSKKSKLIFDKALDNAFRAALDPSFPESSPISTDLPVTTSSSLKNKDPTQQGHQQMTNSTEPQPQPLSAAAIWSPSAPSNAAPQAAFDPAPLSSANEYLAQCGWPMRSQPPNGPPSQAQTPLGNTYPTQSGYWNMYTQAPVVVNSWGSLPADSVLGRNGYTAQQAPSATAVSIQGQPGGSYSAQQTY